MDKIVRKFTIEALGLVSSILLCERKIKFSFV